MQQSLSRLSIPVLNASVFDIVEIVAFEYTNGSPSSKSSLIGVGVHIPIGPTSVNHNSQTNVWNTQIKNKMNGLSAAHKAD